MQNYSQNHISTSNLHQSQLPTSDLAKIIAHHVQQQQIIDAEQFKHRKQLLQIISSLGSAHAITQQQHSTVPSSQGAISAENTFLRQLTANNTAHQDF